MYHLLKSSCWLLLPALLISCTSPKHGEKGMAPDTTGTTIAEKKTFPSLVPGTIQLTENDFGEVIELKGTPVTTMALFEPREIEMLVKDSILILKAHTKSGLIKVLSLPDWNLIREIGVRGQGPDELLFPMLVTSSDPGLLCWIYDLQQEKVYQVDTALVLKETDFPLVKKEGQLFGSKQWVETGDRQFHYASNSTTGKGIYCYLPDSPDSLKLVFDLEDGFKKNLGWTALIGDYGGNREKQRLVYAYKYFHQVRFFDLQTGLIRILQFQAPGNTNAESIDLRAVLAPTSVTHYWGISPQPEHVYCIYSGRTPLEVGKEFKAGTDHIFIEQYDWNGQPVKRYRLDHWGYFCVDEARRTIYVAAVNADEAVYAYEY